MQQGSSASGLNEMESAVKKIFKLLVELAKPKRNHLCVVAAVLFCIAYVGLALTPSSYAIGMHMLGQPASGLIVGSPKPIRSDEWMVFTPYVQIAVNNDFREVNHISPYHENLRSFFSLPLLDWGAIFKPYYAGFAVLPAANAFSFYYLFNIIAFLVGWTLFFRELHIEIRVAALAALALYFSQFTQVWWTSNCGSFALAPWVALAWIMVSPGWLRFLLSSYALTVWMLANAYPPFLYAFGFTMALAILASRPDLITKQRMFGAAIALIVSLCIFVGYFGNIITVMRETVYPGLRESSGGGVQIGMLFAHFYPFLLTKGYEPLKGILNSNACEIGVAASLIPVYVIAFFDYASVKEIINSKKRGIVIIACGLVFVSAWIFMPIPASIGRFAGLTFVPSTRLIPAFGWLLMIESLVLANKTRFRFTFFRIGFLFIILFIALGYKFASTGFSVGESVSYFDLLPMLSVLLLVLVKWLKIEVDWSLPVFLAVAVNLVSFGLFNPIQSAYPIFSMKVGSVEKYLISVGAKVTDGVYAVPGDYGALIAGVGIPSVNHALLAPEMKYFRRRFSDLAPAEFNGLFNRYAHIFLSPDTKAKVIQADLIRLPIDRFSTKGGLQSSGITTKGGRIDRYTWSHGIHGDDITIEGYLNQSMFDRKDIELTGYTYSRSIRQPVVNSAAVVSRGFNFRIELFAAKPQVAMNPVLASSKSSLLVTDAIISGQIVSDSKITKDLSKTKRYGVVDNLKMSSDGRMVELTGWSAADSNHGILYEIFSSISLSSFSIKRIERPDVARLVDPRYLYSGFRIALHSEKSMKNSKICVSVRESSGALSALTFPDGHTKCLELH